MTQHIMVGLDGSSESLEALHWAADEASTGGFQVRIVGCYRIPVAGDIHTGWVATDAYSGIMESAAAQLQRAREETELEHPELQVTSDLFAGAPSAVLVNETSSDTVMIVLGASSHKGASAFWLGSTPRGVIRHASCPVIVVRGSSGHACPERVVVGVDGSDSATKALRWAASEADRYGVQLHVVHAWEYPYATTELGSPQARDLTCVDAACVLNDAVACAREWCGVDVVGELAEDSAPSALLSTVRDGDLLVLSSRGRGALKASVFGSTVNTVLDHADVTVAVIPHTAAR